MRDALRAAQRFLLRNRDLGLAMSLVVIAIYFFSGYFTPVHFDREKIEVRVERGLIQVTGLYHYRNSSRLPTLLTLAVPFPIDAAHPAPVDVVLAEAAEDGRPLAEIEPSRWGRGLRFRLTFRPGEAKWIRLDYAQPTRVANGRYLLTTTQAWRRPIGRAEYLLHLPGNSQLVSSSYALAPVPAPGPGRTYAFSKTSFLPTEDWDFAWKEEPARATRHEGGQP
jgi:hypothetical protein